MADQDYTFKVSFPLDQASAQAAQQAVSGLAAQADKVAGSAAHAGAETGRFVDATGRLREASGRFVAVDQSARQAAEGIGAATGSMKALAESGEGFLGKLETGFGIDFAGKIIEGIQEIGRAAEEFFQRGIEINAERERSGISLAASLKAADPDKYLTFDAARSKGTEVFDLLRVKATGLGLDVKSLTESFQINLNAMTEGGVRNLQKQIDLTVLLGQVAQAKGLSGFTATRDTTDLLTGNANRTMLGRELGIRDEDIRKAQEAGTVYEFITGRLEAYKEAGAAAADTFSATVQTLRNDLDQLAAEATKPAFQELTRLLRELRGTGGSTDATGTARGVGNVLGGAMEGLEKVVSFLGGRKALTDALINEIPGAPILAMAVQPSMDAGHADAEADDRKQRLTALNAEIAAAHTAEAATAARQSLEKELSRAVKETSDATGEAQERAFGYLKLLQDIQNHFASRLGHEPPEIEAHQGEIDAKFTGEIDASPAHQMAVAKATGDEGTAAKLTHDAAVAAETEKLRKEAEKRNEKPSEEALQAKAKENVLLHDQAAALKEIRTENERIDRTLNKGASEADLGRQIGDKTGELARAMSPATRERFTTEQIYGGDAVGSGLLAGVRSMPEVEEKQKLLQIVGELIALEEKRAALLQKDADQEAKNAQHQADQAAAAREALGSVQEQTAILQARARGEDQVADALEKQRDIRREAEQLEKAGVDKAHARAAAEANVTAEIDARHRKEEDRAANRAGRPDAPERHRRGERETFTIHGYSDPDRGGGLHAGGLQTGGLSGGAGSTAAAALAAAPGYTPSFSTLQEAAMRLGVWTGAPGPLAGSTTAAAIAPALGQTAGGAAALPTQGAPGAGANDRLATAAEKTAGSARGVERSAQRAASAMEQLDDSLRRIESQLEDVKKKADLLASHLANSF